MITVSVSEARENLSDLLGKVQHGREDVTIERHGKPVAVMIPVSAYEFYERLWDEQMIRDIEADMAAPDYDPANVVSHKDYLAENLREAKERLATRKAVDAADKVG